MRFIFLKLHSASLERYVRAQISVFAKFLLMLSQVLDTVYHDFGGIREKPFISFGLAVIFPPHYLCMLLLLSSKKPWPQECLLENSQTLHLLSLSGVQFPQLSWFVSSDFFLQVSAGQHIVSWSSLRSQNDLQ